ncbi:MAG: redoxin domain-containing protein [Actinobacteria bacterium]|nr:MAG: redoxin domain-containing protein [Actinomycetota bacterium]
MELLRDRSAEFSEAGVRVFGVSRDSPWTHISWAQALDLNFPLLSDWNADAVHALGIAHEFRGFADVAERSAFLVDPDGTVRGAWRYGTSEVPDFDALLAAAQDS